MNYFTADLHFGHKHMAERRGFLSVGDMDDLLIARWNSVVRSPKDDVWVLGDFSFHNRTNGPRVFHALNGKKSLIRGNHDERAADKLPWEAVYDLHTWRQDGIRLVLCHYPLFTWRNAHHRAFHLHGHSHGSLDETNMATTRLDVGVDAASSDYTPWPLDEIVEYFSTKIYLPVDYHGLETHRVNGDPECLLTSIP